MLLEYFLAWLPMLLIAVGNGAARDLWYRNHVGELPAHQISTISLILLFGVYIRFIMIKYPPASSVQAILVGLFWLTLTLCFEFGFGLLRGNAWSTLLADYNILKGRIWILIPVWITIAPYIFYKLVKS